MTLASHRGVNRFVMPTLQPNDRRIVLLLLAVLLFCVVLGVWHLTALPVRAHRIHGLGKYQVTFTPRLAHFGTFWTLSLGGDIEKVLVS